VSVMAVSTGPLLIAIVCLIRRGRNRAVLACVDFAHGGLCAICLQLLLVSQEAVSFVGDACLAAPSAVRAVSKKGGGIGMHTTLLLSHEPLVKFERVAIVSNRGL
jgi:hypothetical protein